MDDIRECDDFKFSQLMERTRKSFEAKDKVSTLFAFAELSVEEMAYGYTIHHCAYAKSLQELSLDATLEEYRTLHQKTAWRSLTKPDMCFAASISLQVTVGGFNSEHVRAKIKLLRYIIETAGNWNMISQVGLRLTTFSGIWQRIIG